MSDWTSLRAKWYSWLSTRKQCWLAGIDSQSDRTEDFKNGTCGLFSLGIGIKVGASKWRLAPQTTRNTPKSVQTILQRSKKDLMITITFIISFWLNDFISLFFNFVDVILIEMFSWISLVPWFLTLNPWNWIIEPQGSDRTQVKDHWFSALSLLVFHYHQYMVWTLSLVPKIKYTNIFVMREFRRL